MTTEFTRLNHAMITPLMKAKGYRKVGRYCYGGTFDKAVYKRQERMLQVIFTVHPYDYPYHGIHVEEHIGDELVKKKHYSFENGGLREQLNMLAKDINKGTIGSA